MCENGLEDDEGLSSTFGDVDLRERNEPLFRFSSLTFVAECLAEGAVDVEERRKMDMSFEWWSWSELRAICSVRVVSKMWKR